MRDHLALVGILALVGGCIADAPEYDDGIEFGADNGKADGSGAIPLIQTNSPFYWASSDYPSFTTTWAALGGWPIAPAIADTDPLTARLQGWIDKLDGMVRRELERSLGEPLVAPTPILKVVASGQTFNAWVSGTTACLGVNAAGATDDSSKTFVRTDVAYHGGITSCVRPEYPAFDQFRAFWSRPQPKCKVGADGSITGDGCAIETFGAPGELSFLSVSPYIHVSTDLIAAVGEDTLVVVLAHELAHYYRAHVSDAAVQRYNFWYETEVDRKKLPVPSAVAADLERAYAEIAAGPEAVLASAPGHYSPRLRAWILSSIAPLLAQRAEADFVCAGARDALGPWVEPLLSGYGIPTEGLAAYLRFERALVACAPRLQMGSGPSATSLSYGTVLMSVPDAKLPATSFPFYASLADILNALNARAVRLDEKAASLLRRVRDNRIGLYTTEQEADNIALALSVKLGLSPDRVLEAWMGFMSAIVGVVPEDLRPAYEAEHAHCKAQLAEGFTTVDANGNRVPVFVPIGDLTEPHHSDCYRLFNFWREQQLRGYRAATELELEGGWDALRAQARQLSDAARINGM